MRHITDAREFICHFLLVLVQPLWLRDFLFRECVFSVVELMQILTLLISAFSPFDEVIAVFSCPEWYPNFSAFQFMPVNRKYSCSTHVRSRIGNVSSIAHGLLITSMIGSRCLRCFPTLFIRRSAMRIFLINHKFFYFSILPEVLMSPQDGLISNSWRYINGID